MTTPAAVIRPSLEKLLQNATGRRQAALRIDVQALLDRLDEVLQVQGDEPPELELPHLTSPEEPEALPRPARGEHHPGALTNEAAGTLLGVLEAAIDSRRGLLVEPALEALQKLVAHGLVRGTVTVLHHRSNEAGAEASGLSGGAVTAGFSTAAGGGPGTQNRVPLPPAAAVLDLIVRCDDIPDEGVELRLLSALLTAVTSAAVAVHGAALLLCIRAAYNVYLSTRSEVNAATARATLTQALNVCFARMESGDARAVPPPIMVADVLGMAPTETSTLSASVQQFLTDVVASVDPFGSGARSLARGLDAVFVPGAEPRSPTGAEADAAAAEAQEEEDAAAALSAVGGGRADAAADRDGIAWRHGGGSAGAAAAEQAAPEDGTTSSGKGTPRSTAAAGPAARSHAHDLSADATSDAVAAALQRSAFLVFRALCKLSVRSSDGVSDATNARGKVLALELLKIVLENSGPVFASSERFLAAIRQYLCLSLLKNCASSVPGALPPCASIFLTLVRRFRWALKGEIGVFYPLILLRPIEPAAGGVLAHTTGSGSGSAPVDFAYRQVALRCLAALAVDGQALVDLYVNYDCDLEGANLFERTVQALVRIAQGSPGLEAATATPAEEHELRYEALCCLTAILRAMNTWVAQAQKRGAGGAKDEGSNDEEDDESGGSEDEEGVAAATDEDLRAPATRATRGKPPLSRKKVQKSDRGHAHPSSVTSPGRRLHRSRTDAELLAQASAALALRDSRVRARWMAEAQAQDAESSGAEGSGAAEGGAAVSGGPLSPRPGSSASAAADTPQPQQPSALNSTLEGWRAFKRVYLEGIALFNTKPAKGVAFMQEQGLVGSDAAAVAQFLSRTAALDKAKVGDYLGEREPFNLKVMHAYVDALDFNGLEFDAAIRRYLEGFRLPGEAQKIDRLMEKFAERYLRCNPETFKSADVAYVLAYSVIMLNTDAHNPGVKNKMSKADFIKNNRGINDGGDLDGEFMSALYDRIVGNEIRMRDDAVAALDGAVGSGMGGGVGGAGGGGGAAGASATASASQASHGGAAGSSSSGGWFETLAALLPGRGRAAAAEPSDEVLAARHAALRQRAAGATFHETSDPAAALSAFNAAWAPVLGALSTVFEESDAPRWVMQCLAGLVAASSLACALGAATLRDAYVSSLTRFTMLHSPSTLRLKHAQAFRALLVVAEHNGNALGPCWQDVLRCISRFELLQTATAGVPSDAFLFASPTKDAAGSKPGRTSSSTGSGWGGSMVSSGGGGTGGSAVLASSAATAQGGGPLQASINDMGLHAAPPAGSLPAPEVMRSVEPEELDRVFVQSVRLDSDGIVAFVTTLCGIAREELRVLESPRVFSLTKIVEIAAYNMDRIRLVWARIWGVLGEFFVWVGCLPSLPVAMYGVDSLRQLATRFLERDELTNFSFQSEFLRPFCVVARRSRAPEIRELVIRCVSAMVLARVANVKSGWKAVFMVFTTAAGDDSAAVVRLAFDTVEKIVRQHFDYITETEASTFTDCVNCLIAYTNNPHSMDVALNAIAFLRFCALQLAAGGIGGGEDQGDAGAAGDQQQSDKPESPVDTAAEAAAAPFRIRPRGDKGESEVERAGKESSSPPTGDKATRPPSPVVDTPLKFSDREQHVFYWFPLLAGLGELTFDPRTPIRTSALDVLFDILQYHGGTFTPAFWLRVFDSVLLPIFDVVRAELADATTFTDEARRAEADAWLYATCTRTLAHIVDVVASYNAGVPGLLDRVLELLAGFIARPHAQLAAVGVAGLARLAVALAPGLDEPGWAALVKAFRRAAADVDPDVAGLVARRSQRFDGGSSAGGGSGSSAAEHQNGNGSEAQRHRINEDHHRQPQRPRWSLGRGAGARRLSETRTHAATSLLVAQAAEEVCRAAATTLPPAAAAALLDVVEGIASRARGVDADLALRASLALAQAADGVVIDRALPDPPLLELEAGATASTLGALSALRDAGSTELAERCALEPRLAALCLDGLARFLAVAEEDDQESDADIGGGSSNLDDDLAAVLRDGPGGAALPTASIAAPMTVQPPQASSSLPAPTTAATIAHQKAVAARAEAAALAPLATTTLRALCEFDDAAFRAHARDLFPHLVKLIAVQHAPRELRAALSDLFLRRVGNMLAA